MKNFLKTTLLASVLALCATATASANQLLVYVTAGQLLTAMNAADPFGNNCLNNMTDCGVYGVGFLGATGGTANVTASSGSGAVSPSPTGSTQWASYSVLGSPGFEIGGTATQEQFITNNTQTVGDTYTANISGINMTGVAAMNTSTQIGFLVNFGSTVTAGTTTNVSFRLVATQLNVSSGAQGAKDLAGVVTVNGLTLSAVPEPSSIGLALSGLSALGVAAWRRRKLLSK